MKKTPMDPGFECLPDYLDKARQETLRDVIMTVAARAPLFRPTMPRSGRPFSVLMTSAGPFGWVSDRSGYRYTRTHPQTGEPWPPIPEPIVELWREIGGYPAPPECCLINFYAAGTRMGLHQDRDEDDFTAPVLSVSLGDTAVFRIGGPSRRGPTRSMKLRSGDIVILRGPDRLAFHGIDRVLAGSSRLLPEGGRYNITLRRVTRPDPTGCKD
jgi:alkylated DNA repair protein (DNA oxidative demethylase)